MDGQFECVSCEGVKIGDLCFSRDGEMAAFRMC